MSPQVFYLLWEAKRPRDPEQDFAGRLTEKDCAELYADLEE